MNVSESADGKGFDVIIVGGSYAGMSAAMALGRSLRRVLVVDAGQPCNAQTPHSQNFLTQDGKTPAGISEIARRQLSVYDTVKTVNDTVVNAEKISEGFDVALLSGGHAFAKKLIFATGIKDQLPDIPGFSRCWGISVVHCPYCHGYEYRGKKTAIFANGETAMHYAMLVSNLTKDLQILTGSKPAFSDEQMAILRKHNITVNESEIVEIEHKDGYLRNVVFKGGEKRMFDALYFRPPFTQHSDIPQLLGAEVNEQGYLKVDASQKTLVEGLFACGDNTNMMRSVANAVSSGNIAGAVVNRELAMELF